MKSTLIRTEKKYKLIENIKIGDYVLSKNIKDDSCAYKKVLNIFYSKEREFINVFIKNDVIKVTHAHRFYVKIKGWVKAKDLDLNSILIDSNGNEIIINKIVSEVSSSEIEVYNFEVEDFNTYFVSKSKILVHNMSINSGGGKTK